MNAAALRQSTFAKAAAARAWLSAQFDPYKPFDTREGRMYERAELRELARLQQREQLAEKLAESLAFERADPFTKSIIAAKRALSAELPEREARRHAGCALADYVRARVLPLVGDLDEANALANWCGGEHMCRVNGTVGVLADGEPVTMWDYKCGKSRLCPDEAREEMMRLAAHYAPQIQLAAARHDMRVFAGVLTFPHAEPGRLAHHLRYLVERFNEKILDAKRPCTDDDRRAFGYSARKKLVYRFRPGLDADQCFETRKDPETGKERRYYVGQGIHGSLIVTECPLSKDGRWNVHINFLLVVKGRFDFKELYDAWRDGADHMNLHIRQVDASDPYDLACTLREIIKYAAAHTGTKSAEKAAQGASQAPPMTDWPPELWLEWHRALTGYRRARAYGCLYNAPDESEEQDLAGATWIGRIQLDDLGTYWVDLIPDDKFCRPGPPDHKDDYFPPGDRPPGGRR